MELIQKYFFLSTKHFFSGRAPKYKQLLLNDFGWKNFPHEIWIFFNKIFINGKKKFFPKIKKMPMQAIRDPLYEKLLLNDFGWK